MNIIKNSISLVTDYIQGQPHTAGANKSSNSIKKEKMSPFPPPPIPAKGTEGKTGISAVKNGVFLCFSVLCPPFLIGYAVTSALINAHNKYFAPKSQNSFRTNTDKYTQSLESLYNKKDKDRNPLIKFAQNIFSSYKNSLRKTQKYNLSKGHNRTILIQENLITHVEGDRATFDKLQIKAFIKHTKLKNTPSKNFINL
ncbi:MAG: hypothetical protein H0U27_03075 [Nitrosopumilus sp.]|nr:hypothetical protein [Nitrosopumilus sp.]